MYDDPDLHPGDPSIECPVCHTAFAPKRRFCPVCGEPRTVVKQELADQVRATGLPYEELLRREREADSIAPRYLDVPQARRAPEPKVTHPAEPLSRRGKIVLIGGGVFLLVFAVAAVVAGAVSSDDDRRSPARSVGREMSESEYADEIVSINTDVAQSMSRFSDLATDARFTNTGWRNSVDYELDIWRGAYSEVQRMEPPSRYDAVHRTYTSALRQLNQAAGLIEAGIDDFDASQLELAIVRIEDAGRLFQDATLQLERLD